MQSAIASEFNSVPQLHIVASSMLAKSAHFVCRVFGYVFCHIIKMISVPNHHTTYLSISKVISLHYGMCPHHTGESDKDCGCVINNNREYVND